MEIVIGIDPGKLTGIAVSKNGKLIDIFIGNFWSAIDSIDHFPDAIVIIEIPDTKHVWHNHAKAKGAIQRTGVNVGSVIREAELLVEYLIRNERTYLTQKPQGKMNADQFRLITGWTGRTNQHMRDAGLLCFGVQRISGAKE
jgi:hypothetical protein